jgi:hypothetical protein
MFMAQFLGVCFGPAGAVRGRAYDGLFNPKSRAMETGAWPHQAARGLQQTCRIENRRIFPETFGHGPTK